MTEVQGRHRERGLLVVENRINGGKRDWRTEDKAPRVIDEHIDR